MNFLIIRDGERHGPYTQQQVKEGLEEGWLRVTDLIWYEGLENWKRVDDVFTVERLPAGASAPASPVPAAPVGMSPAPGPASSGAVGAAERPIPKATAPVAPFAAQPESSLPARTQVMKKHAPPVKRAMAPRPEPKVAAAEPPPSKPVLKPGKPRAGGTAKWVTATILLVVAGVLIWLGLTVWAGMGAATANP